MTRPTALITGASRGIGRAIAVKLATTYDLVIVAREQATLNETAAAARAVGAQVQLLPLDVNVNALYHESRAVLPGTVKRGRGHICTIGSIAGRNTFAGGTCYSGTKHFVMGFAESLMLEVRDGGVRVSVIVPGSVDTGLFPPGINRSWMVEPEDVASAVAFAVSTPPQMLVHRLEVRALWPKRPRTV